MGKRDQQVVVIVSHSSWAGSILTIALIARTWGSCRIVFRTKCSLIQPGQTFSTTDRSALGDVDLPQSFEHLSDTEQTHRQKSA